MPQLPLVSLIITNYNRQSTIAKAIESALQQDYGNLEVIISDNCSTDNSDEIIKKYTNDERVKYYRNETNIGMLLNFKISFEERAKGEFITIVNSDDELVSPSFIKDCIKAVLSNDNVVLVKSNFYFAYPNKNVEMNYDNYNRFYKGVIFLKEMNLSLDFGWAGILLKRDIINNLKIFDTGIIASDYIANFNMLLYGNVCFTNCIAYKFNVHDDNVGKNTYQIKQVKKILEELTIFFKKLSLQANAETYTQIKQKFDDFYLKSMYTSTYINNRNDVNEIKILLHSHCKDEYLSFIQSAEIKKFNVLYFFPKFGQRVTALKKSIFGLIKAK
ncbi:MAG: glycosyltransferase family 2 protein [Ferruginibacter sp.]|nr:glycosyltransferase family 2 protein [Ferruginibacter sp.]